MLRKAAAIIVILMLVTAGTAFAGSGEIILQDTLYGGLIGGLLGGAWYLLDDDDAADKIGMGIGLGIIGGFAMGVTDVSASVKIEKGEVKLAMPMITIDKVGKGVGYKTNILQMNF